MYPVSSELYTLSLHDALPIFEAFGLRELRANPSGDYYSLLAFAKGVDVTTSSMTFKTYSTRGFNYSGSARVNQLVEDRKSTRLNSSHLVISYAVFCLKKTNLR